MEALDDAVPITATFPIVFKKSTFSRNVGFVAYFFLSLELAAIPAIIAAILIGGAIGSENYVVIAPVSLIVIAAPIAWALHHFLKGRGSGHVELWSDRLEVSEGGGRLVFPYESLE